MREISGIVSNWGSQSESRKCAHYSSTKHTTLSLDVQQIVKLVPFTTVNHTSKHSREQISNCLVRQHLPFIRIADNSTALSFGYILAMVFMTNVHSIQTNPYSMWWHCDEFQYNPNKFFNTKLTHLASFHGFRIFQSNHDTWLITTLEQQTFHLFIPWRCHYFSHTLKLNGKNHPFVAPRLVSPSSVFKPEVSCNSIPLRWLFFTQNGRKNRDTQNLRRFRNTASLSLLSHCVLQSTAEQNNMLGWPTIRLHSHPFTSNLQLKSLRERRL